MIIVKYESAAFACRPPGTICTCLTWLSADFLVAGCSNGSVAIWSMSQCLQAQNLSIEETGQSSDSIPFWYHSLHSTYIISVAAHQPYPGEYITTNGVDGKVRLTSIRNPYMDSVYGSRERHLMPPLVYSPHILGIYEIDETDGLRARPLRHMPVSRAIGKAPAQVLCMDAGKLHPTLLFGCADGHVILTNPIRRMFIRRLTDERVEAWQQTWFRHEFVPTSRSQPTDFTSCLARDAQETSHIRPRPGTSRFVESFKLESASWAKKVQAVEEDDIKKKQDQDAHADASTLSTRARKKQKKMIKQRRQQEQENVAGLEDVHISIFEEEQAVTCVCWNPNLQAGGWAAAGMANGLIRIEDLAV